jgi:histidyl-tRNA synthetase
VKVNSRKVLDGILEGIGLTGDGNAGRRLKVLRAIDKLDRLGIDGVRALLGKGRKDESGDFTEGAGLDWNAIQSIAVMFDLSAIASKSFDTRLSHFEPEIQKRVSIVERENGLIDGVLAGAYQLVAKSARGLEGLSDLRQIWGLVSDAGYNDGRIRVDTSVVRGLEYYTGPVFEAELTVPITDDRGQPIRLGSVVSGGRYDGLVERFTGEKVPATGISIGVSRLLFGLQRLGKFQTSATQGPVVVLVLDRDRIADYQRMAQQLRNAGIRAEMYLGESGMKAQMKYADKRGSPCAVIQGGDEKTKGEVQIKDLILGATLTGTKDRDEYLKQQAEAQFTVPQSNLVEAVQRVLARHKA